MKIESAICANSDDLIKCNILVTWLLNVIKREEDFILEIKYES